MVFSSVTFLFAFLPVVLAGYYLLPKRIRNAFLLLCSLGFYFASETWLVWIMLASILVDYSCARLITRERLSKKGRRTRIQRGALIVSLAANLGILFYFKYCGFFVENVNSVLSSMGLDDLSWPIRNIALPMGISFYTFQSMSYTIDVYFGRVKPTRNLLNFATYVSLFPQLVAGPIIRYRHIHTQLTGRRHSPELFVSGIKRFIIGLAKKVLIADVLGQVADAVFSMPNNDLTCQLAWMGAICFSLQLYYDFSGYSDMAIGLGRMFGFEFIENFNYPFIANSFHDFWRRWHISMTTWFRDYVYIPLRTNNLAGPYSALLITFLLCGLWHGAEWNFVLFGIFTAGVLMMEVAFIENILKRMPVWGRHLYALLMILVAMIFFRSESISEIHHMLQALVQFNAGDTHNYPLARFMTPDTWMALFVGLIGSAPIFHKIKPAPSWVRFIGYMLLFLMSCAFVAGSSFNPFLYFRF